MSGNKYAISDVHGCLETFKYLVEDVIELKTEDTLYLLGDFVDRGPNSKGVLDYVMQLQENYHVKASIGNHEELMVNSLLNNANLEHWVKNCGGKETLASFGVERPQDIPQKYFDFIDSLDYYFEDGDYYLVHAGFNPKDPFGDREAMLWIRGFELNYDLMVGKKVIHGHTPKIIESIIRTVQANEDIICIDAGCVFGFKGGIQYGHLACFNLDTSEVLYADRVEEGANL